MRRILGGLAVFLGTLTCTQADMGERQRVDQLADTLEPRLIAWRRDIHQHPELGNREFRTAALVAEHLKRLGLDVKTGVGRTGVVAILRGGLPGPVVALRADMDALPVTEQSGLPFASQARANWMGEEVGVAHVCGHDGHTAILMGVAEVLTTMRAQLPGTVKFIFQPAEEGPPPGEDGGATLMIRDGALRDPVPAAIFGLHLNSRTPLGKAGVRAGPLMASGDTFSIVVKGSQTHAALPWLGVDPVVLASQVVLGIQTIQSRQVNVLQEPSVVTIATIHGGNRPNIIPDTVAMSGMIRALDEDMRRDIQRRVATTADAIARSAGGSAEVSISPNYDVTVNDARLAELGARSLRATLGSGQVFENPKVTVSEDFSAYQKVIPGFFFFLGVVPDGTPPEKVFPNHSPRFWIDERVLKIGVRSLANVTLDYLHETAAKLSPALQPASAR
ncbi:amidohydrolase [Zoogloea sp. LCSB751]|uniref:amidohydrolase n=1 Tax=Zoogloea sp. LCSB751 TaxID=1965277 RepID=UPI0009A52EA3|nr:amidohydrolase [Zoogloea sp. LCSB751]